jgi:hypothetical protein
MKSIVRIFSIFFCVLWLGACQTVTDAVRGPSEGLGAASAVPQAITQGVASGYTDHTGAHQANPYGR